MVHGNEELKMLLLANEELSMFLVYVISMRVAALYPILY